MADGSYADVTNASSIVNMSGDAGTITWLTNNKPYVDREVDNDFRAYIDLIPYISGAPQDLIAIATWRLAALWFADNKDFNSQKYWDARANKLVTATIERAKAEGGSVNTRTSMQGKSKGYMSDPLQSEGNQPSIWGNTF